MQLLCTVAGKPATIWPSVNVLEVRLMKLAVDRKVLATASLHYSISIHHDLFKVTFAVVV
jgi:hypothetical protein